MAYTENIRKAIPRLIYELDVSTIFDAPCGDSNWIKSVEWDEGVQYIGADIVDALVDRGRALSRNGHTRYLNLDVVTDDFPKADLWLCRDCLIHFSNDDIWRAMKNFLKSGIRYLLASTYPERNENVDIRTGSFREVNLQLAPFNFGEPLTMIKDWIPGFPKKQLALWEAADLGVTA